MGYISLWVTDIALYIETNQRALTVEHLKTQLVVAQPNVEPQVVLDANETLYVDKAGINIAWIASLVGLAIAVAVVSRVLPNVPAAAALVIAFVAGIFLVVRIASSLKVTSTTIRVGGKKVELSSLDTSFGIWPAETLFESSALRSFQHGLSYTRGQGQIKIYGGVVGRDSSNSWVAARDKQSGVILVFSPARRDEFIFKLRTFTGLASNGSDVQVPVLGNDLRHLFALSGYVDSPWAIAATVTIALLIIGRLGLALLTALA